jgi:hypothetical protein
LFLESPAWLGSNEHPWSCLRDEAPYELESTTPCGRCVLWEPRSSSAGAFDGKTRSAAAPFALDIFS